MDLYARSSAALYATVHELTDDEFGVPSGCSGWLVRDLVCHLIVDAQDVLITLVSPAETEVTRDAYTYWTVSPEPPTSDDPFDALIVRLAAAYREPSLLRHHFDDVYSAARRAAALADGNRPVTTQGFVLTTRDYLTAYVLEWTLHHLDLIAHLPHASEPPPETLAYARGMLETIADLTFPRSFGDADALRVGTGRRAPTPAEVAELGEAAERIPFVLG